jgi:hypothetical protein
MEKVEMNELDVVHLFFSQYIIILLKNLGAQGCHKLVFSHNR